MHIYSVFPRPTVDQSLAEEEFVNDGQLLALELAAFNSPQLREEVYTQRPAGLVLQGAHSFAHYCLTAHRICAEYALVRHKCHILAHCSALFLSAVATCRCLEAPFSLPVSIGTRLTRQHSICTSQQC